MGFSRLLLILLRRNRLLSPSPSQLQWPCRSKTILSAFLSNRVPIFGAYRGIAHNRALLLNESPVDPRLEFVAEQVGQFETEDIEQQNVDTHKTKQRQAVEEVIAAVSLEKNTAESQYSWSEWTALMGYLVSKDYFKGFADDDRKDFLNDSDILKDYNHVRNACLNFGRDRFDILRSLSKEDIQAIVEHGCPSLDRKVVNSGKRLRSYVNIEEGEVCSKCNLRGSCDRAYINISNEECARTVDLMRILLTYGIDPVISSTETKLQMKKTVKASICKLLKDVVELAATPLDPTLPRPIPTKTGQMVREAPPPPRKRIGFADIEMKAGDWRCPGCNLVNFARNAICIQCNERRPKSTLQSGDWECPDCSFFNFQRNMKCFKCDCNRPKDGQTEDAKELNPGDWKCPKCNFLNFRRNMTCLECDYKHPKNDQTEIAKQLNPADWKCPKCNFLNFKRNMTCIKCDCKHPGDYHTENARELNPGDWKCPECNFMNFGRNMRCLKCDFRHLKDEDKEYNFRAKTNDDMLNSPRRRNSAGLGGDHYNFDDFPVRGGKSEIAHGRLSREHGNKKISQFGSGINRSSSVVGNSNDVLDFDLLDEDDDDSDNDSDVDFKQKRTNSGRSYSRSSRSMTGEHGNKNISQFGSGINRSSSVGGNSNDLSDLDLFDEDDDDSDNDKQKRTDSRKPPSTSARAGGRAGKNLAFDDFPVRGSSRTAGLRKLERNENKTFSEQNHRGDNSSVLGGHDPNDFSDLDSEGNGDDYKWKGADGRRSSGSGSVRYGRLSTSLKGKGMGYDDTDDEGALVDIDQGKRLGPPERSLSSKSKSVKKSFEDGLVDSDQEKRLGPPERSLSSKSKSVKKSFENFGDLDEDDDDDLCESEDEQPQVSRITQKGDKRSLSLKSKFVEKSSYNFGDFDDDDNLSESEDEQPQVSRTKQKGNRKFFRG